MHYIQCRIVCTLQLYSTGAVKRAVKAPPSQLQQGLYGFAGTCRWDIQRAGSIFIPGKSSLRTIFRSGSAAVSRGDVYLYLSVEYTGAATKFVSGILHLISRDV